MDIEIVTAPTKNAFDVLGRDEFKRYLRISTSDCDQDEEIDQAILEAFDKIGGPNNELNRTILPTTFRRYLSRFPGLDECGKPKPILIPYPPLIRVEAITIEDGSSPENTLPPDSYVVKSGMLVPEVHPVAAWPSVTAAPRAISVTFANGYRSDEYPPKFKRLLKILAAHYFENIEATINEPRQMMINRKVEFGVEDLRDALKVSAGYDDWGE